MNQKEAIDRLLQGEIFRTNPLFNVLDVAAVMSKGALDIIFLVDRNYYNFWESLNVDDFHTAFDQFENLKRDWRNRIRLYAGFRGHIELEFNNNPHAFNVMIRQFTELQ